MRLYEINYVHLLPFMPLSGDVGSSSIYDIQGKEFQIDIVESTRYTTLLGIFQRGDEPNYLKARLTVRMYHDARLAEVCSSQQISRIKPRYDYPNPRMHQCDEKHQINAFLHDWLAYCLQNGITKKDNNF